MIRTITITCVLIQVACYLAAGFIEADFNAWHWSSDRRAQLVAVSAFLTAVITMTLYIARD